MARNAFEERAADPEIVLTDVYFAFNSTGTPTKTRGTGVTVARTGVGTYTLTWAEDPGIFCGPPAWSLLDATPGNLKNYSIVFSSYTAATKVLAFTVYNASGTATDPASTSYAWIGPRFAQTSVKGA